VADMYVCMPCRSEPSHWAGQACKSL